MEQVLAIEKDLFIPLSEIEINAVRSQGAGGQNVNKVSSAIHLRFDISASSLPALYKKRLLALHDRRITVEGVVVIKAQQYRSREKNRLEALRRLRRLIQSVTATPPTRKPTTPTQSSRSGRLERKRKRGEIKALRGKISEEE